MISLLVKLYPAISHLTHVNSITYNDICLHYHTGVSISTIVLF